jgi:very-short-patch-repair endonuclease
LSLQRDRRFTSCKFRRQRHVEPFMRSHVYCHEARLAKEQDSRQRNEPDARARYEERTTFLEARGIPALRFWDNDVFNVLDGVLRTIYEALSPSPSGEGGGEGLHYASPMRSNDSSSRMMCS